MGVSEKMIEGRSAGEVLLWGRTLVEPAMRAVVDTLPGSMRRIAGYHFGWWDEKGSPASGDGGKAIRPTLTILAAEAVGGDPSEAVPAAVAVELVHNFSLLHDDVMDADTTRRHRATAWSVFGGNPAILAGDVLLALAFDVLAAGDHRATPLGMRSLSGAVLELLAGQAADMSFEDREDVELTECVRMVAGKTGALLACACAVGATFGGAGPEGVTEMRDFGAELGMAFQCVDDLLGIWGDPAVTGKPVYSDLQNRKKSLPVVAALNSGTPAGAELAALMGKTDPLSAAELARAAGLIESAGARDWSRAQAAERLSRALRRLPAVAPGDPRGRAVKELSTLAHLIAHRDR